jgi:ribosomal protein L11 methylase PrmA
MQAIKQHLGEQGVVVFSGLLTGDKDEMIEHAKVHSLSLLQGLEKDNWISLAFCHKA